MLPDGFFEQIATTEALDRLVERSAREPVVLYKHSRLCSQSARARRNLARLADVGTPPIYEVVVQEARPLSNEIARRLAVRHESPQVIVLHAGRPVFHASHHRVTAQGVRTALDNLSAR